MNKSLLLVGLSICLLACGFTQKGKILYDSPTEDDIIVVNLALGRETVLSFSEPVIVPSVGDEEMIRVEKAMMGKDIHLKPRKVEASGVETNLFCWTEKKRYNFHLIVGPVEKVNYVINVDSVVEQQNRGKKLSLQDMLYYCRAYDQLYKMGIINERVLERTGINKVYQNKGYGVELKVKDIFFHQRPHWLAISVKVTNRGQNIKWLKKRLSYLYINGHKRMPSSVIFDLTELSAGSSTLAYFVLEDTNLSRDNNFVPSIGVGNEEVCFEE